MLRTSLALLALILLLVIFHQQATINHLREQNDDLYELLSGTSLDHARTQGSLAGLQEVYRSNLTTLFQGLSSSKDIIADLTRTISIQKHQIKSLREGHILTITAYSPEESQTDSTPFITANNKRVREGIVAVSPDLFEKGWTFGRKIYIKDLGVFTIDDLSARKNRNHVDVFMFSTPKALQFGRKKMRVYLLGA